MHKRYIKIDCGRNHFLRVSLSILWLIKIYFMSRNNIWAHLAIALVLVLVAAFAGQIAHWRRNWTPVKQSSSSPEASADSDQSEESNSDDQRNEHKAEVLV